MNKAADNYTGSNYDEFIALSKVQKTLRNELKPTPFTAEHIKQRGIISEDEYRAQQSLELKKIADEYYRNYITHKLNDINNLDFYNLFDAIEEKYKKNDKENRDKLDLVEKSKRGEIAKMLSADDNFKSMFEAKLITKLLPDYVERNYAGEDKEKALETLTLFSETASYNIIKLINRINAGEVFSFPAPEKKANGIVHNILYGDWFRLNTTFNHSKSRTAVHK